MRDSHIAIRLALLTLACSACDQLTLVQVPDPPPPVGDAQLGAAAFDQECASCHASGDGFDLVFFGFPDSTIVRRAVAHVDTATAQDIVAYLRGLGVSGLDRETRLFQPGGTVLSGDIEFAERLFGIDSWPATLTTDDLLALDPRHTPVAVAFPVWSQEISNLDWMPDTPVSDGVLGYRNGLPVAALERYYGAGSVEDLIAAVQSLRAAERDPTNADAPCVLEPIDRLSPAECFETRRWIASLGAQYMLREAVEGPLHPGVHDAWWDVGNAVRRSLGRDRQFENGVENWAAWMYLGWSFEPSRHASIYLSLALDQLGLERHIVYHSLRAMVSRPGTSAAPFEDVRNAARFAPAHWTFDATSFGFRHLIERLEAGFGPRADRVDDAVLAVERAFFFASLKTSDAEALALSLQKAEILALIG